MTQVDYDSAVLAGLPSHLLNRLQSMLLQVQVVGFNVAEHSSDDQPVHA